MRKKWGERALVAGTNRGMGDARVEDDVRAEPTQAERVEAARVFEASASWPAEASDEDRELAEAALSYSLSESEVAHMLADARAKRDTCWRRKLDRLVEQAQELRAERDHWTARALRAEAAIARVERVATAQSYLRRPNRDPRFVLSGREVLRALEDE